MLQYAFDLKQKPGNVDDRMLPTRRHDGIRLNPYKNRKYCRSIYYRASEKLNNLNNGIGIIYTCVFRCICMYLNTYICVYTCISLCKYIYEDRYMYIVYLLILYKHRIVTIFMKTLNYHNL